MAHENLSWVSLHQKKKQKRKTGKVFTNWGYLDWGYHKPLLIPPPFMDVSGLWWEIDSSPHRHCLSYDMHISVLSKCHLTAKSLQTKRKNLPFYSQSDPDTSHLRYRIALGCLSGCWRHRCFQRTMSNWIVWRSCLYLPQLQRAEGHASPRRRHGE